MSVLRRLILSALAVQAGLVGAWAAALPRSFYDRFPGLGRAWVAGTGPYSEHLVRDVGTLSLALGVLTVAAAVRSRWVRPAVCAAAWLVYSTPHLLYHLRGDDHLAPSDRWMSLAALGLQVALPLLLLTPRAGFARAAGSATVRVTAMGPEAAGEGGPR
jgi:hypothetical protein